MPDTLDNKIKAIDAEVLQLHYKWKYFKQIFGTNEKVALLNNTAQVFFGYLWNSMLFDILLSFSRLLDPRYFQISVPVQPGNSGGALVDERGNVIGIVSAKLDAGAALAASGALPENVNYAVKSSLLLSFLESVPDVDAKLKAPNTADEKFEDVVKSAQDAAVLVLVY
jgi:S1-C subfamily serine protease